MAATKKNSFLFSLMILLFLTLFYACGQAPKEQASEKEEILENQASSTKEEVPKNQQASNDSDNLASTFFDAATFQQIKAIKQLFDEGLLEGYNNRSESYVYEQHALRMRLDLINNESYLAAYPYNGKFDLSGKEDLVSGLPFLTKNCGFQNEKTNVIEHYYCLGLEGRYFDYLEQLLPNTLIANFVEQYKKIKTINADMKYNIVMHSLEELDFNNLDHQLFYMLFHICVNEERIAVEKMKQSN